MKSKYNNKKNKLLFGIIIISCILFIAIKMTYIIYPIKYKEYVHKYAEQYGVSEKLIYSVIKAESRFNADAESGKGAKGLMQITVDTGQWAANKMNLSNFTEESLFDPDTNIQIGCWYISQLAAKYDYKLDLVLAAYNAGSGNVTRWLKNTQYSYDGENVHNIPFKETKGYVKKVKNNLKCYNLLYFR